MFDLYYWPTPNNHKITLFFEEAGVSYALHPVSLPNKEQLTAEFEKISPNHKVPALVDREPLGGGAPISVFESGAILQYLGNKTNQFYPADARARVEVDQWLFWQMAGLGPMAGQQGHFKRQAPSPIPYAINRYHAETERLLTVLNRRLQGREYVAGAYSIADMAIYPWLVVIESMGHGLSAQPDVKAWVARVAARPATERAFNRAKEFTYA